MQEMSAIKISGTPEEVFDKFYIAINDIMYIRRVHEKRYFEDRVILGQTVKIACIKLTQDYLSTLRDKLIPML